MAFTIKQKLISGIVFLFILILLAGGFGIYYLLRLKEDSKRIISNNYESLEYCHNIQQSLDSIDIGHHQALINLENKLVKQEGNITEKGEKEATALLRQHFNSFNNSSSPDSTLLSTMQHDVQQIIELNMQAIQRKNKIAEATAHKATTYISVIATLILIISLSFIFNFSSIFTTPINKLKEAIEAISKKDYSHRIHLTTKDEFSQLADAFNQMAERLNDYESSNLNKLMFEKARAEAVINSLQDAGIGIDKDDKLLFANDQALSLLGLKAPDIIGRPIDDIAAKNDLFRFLVKEDSNAPFKIVVDGRESYFIKEINNITINDAIVGKVYSIKNITSFRERDVAKTNFLATISHELKTPLASTDIGLKLLATEKNNTLSDEQKEIIKDLQKDNQRLLKLVSELLDLSQAETGNINLNITAVAPAEIIQTAINAMKQTAAEKNVQIEVQQPAATRMVSADKEKAVWVLMNLLSNAIKFSPVSETVYINVQQKDDTVSISVTDKGPGIPQEYHQRIFERFFKVPGSQQFHKGTGLGLSISREFMQAMNGSISISSQPGSGTSFTLLFNAEN